MLRECDVHWCKNFPLSRLFSVVQKCFSMMQSHCILWLFFPVFWGIRSSRNHLADYWNVFLSQSFLNAPSIFLFCSFLSFSFYIFISDPVRGGFLYQLRDEGQVSIFCKLDSLFVHHHGLFITCSSSVSMFGNFVMNVLVIEAWDVYAGFPSFFWHVGLSPQHVTFGAMAL